MLTRSAHLHTPQGILLGNDCENEIRSFSLEFTGIPPGRTYSLYSFAIGAADICKRYPPTVEVSGNPARCLSKGNKPTVAGVAWAPLKGCRVANGDVLKFTVSNPCRGAARRDGAGRGNRRPRGVPQGSGTGRGLLPQIECMHMFVTP
jgi:hypothetical protein